MNTSRLPSLPKDIRDSYRVAADLRYHATNPSPETYRSDYSLYSMSDAKRASLDLEAITYFRGRAHAGGFRGGTMVYVLAVYDDHVIAYDSDHAYVGRHRRDLVWHPTGEVVDYEDEKAQRRRAVIAAEHKLAEKMKARHREVVEKAKAQVAKAAHDALASTRLAGVQAQIAEHEKALAKLRDKEAALVVETMADAAVKGHESR